MGNWFDERAKSSARRHVDEHNVVPIEPTAEGQFSRRDALKRGGIVAGVAWTAPVLMSVMTPAAAAAPCPTGSTPCPGFPGGCCPANDSGIPDTCVDGVCIDPGEPGGFCLNNGQGAGGCNDPTIKCNNPGPGPTGRGICGGPGAVCLDNGDCFGSQTCQTDPNKPQQKICVPA